MRGPRQGQGHRGVHRLAHVFSVSRAEKLGDDDRGARGDAHKKAQQQVDQRAGGAHRRQGAGAHILPHHYGVHRVVQLLEEGPDQDGEKEDEQLFPDHPWVMLFSLTVCSINALLSLFFIQGKAFRLERAFIRR